MTTVIFVHGTGGREVAYAQTFQKIEDTFSQRKADIKLVPCLWGEVYGTKLNAGGVSIPNYELTGGGTHANLENDSVKLWDNLYQDPFYEIRLLSFRPIRGQAAVPGRQNPLQELHSRVQQLTASLTLKTQLEKAKIADVFDLALKEVTKSQEYARLLETASRPLDEYYAAVARAIVAEMIDLYIAAETIELNKQFIYTPIPRIWFDRDLRDDIVNSINRELTQDTQSRGAVVINQFIRGSKYLVGEKYLQRQRGALTDTAYPFIGDILYYQAKGKNIRDFIQEQVKKATPPVVLLAHSLGGIACVDLLVEQQLPQVKLLVTVGSQAPFLYEINALQSLAYGDELPQHFPKWLNIYDLRDTLSYVGAELFPGKIKDVIVDNDQPFPESHREYWYTEATWDAILEELP